MKLEDLDSVHGKLYLEREYVTKQRSTYDIAVELGTYPNRIRRALLLHGIKLRTYSQAQKSGMQAGRHFHPTAGRHRTPEERELISKGVQKNWERMEPYRREEISDSIRYSKEKLPQAVKDRINSAAHRGSQAARTEGSQLERAIFVLLKRDFQVEHRTEGDIFLPTKLVVIEMDGPAHHVPIYGQDKLVEVQAKDAADTAELLARGLSVIRVKSVGNVSPAQINALYREITQVLEFFPGDEPEVLFLEV